jgi:TatA/E family protein of Tat protein translocase
VNLGPWHLLAILVVALLVFGPNKVPEMARQLGKGMREFRRIQASLHADVTDLLGIDDDDDEPGAPFHPTPQASGSRPSGRNAAPAPLPGRPPVAAPSRFRTPGGGRVSTRMRVSVRRDVPGVGAVPKPQVQRVTAPSRFRAPRHPDTAS